MAKPPSRSAQSGAASAGTGGKDRQHILPGNGITAVVGLDLLAVIFFFALDLLQTFLVFLVQFRNGLRNAYTVPRGFGGKENTERGTRHHRHHAEDHDDEQGRGPTRRDGRHQRLRGHPQGFEPGANYSRNLLRGLFGGLRRLFGQPGCPGCRLARLLDFSRFFCGIRGCFGQRRLPRRRLFTHGCLQTVDGLMARNPLADILRLCAGGHGTVRLCALALAHLLPGIVRFLLSI